MPDKAKTGSSRRKGDEYQDLSALRLALELYIERKPFELFIEYENVGNLDDVVVVQPQRVDAYQVKFAVNPHATYGRDDFLDAKANVYFGRFASSWKQLISSHPGHAVTVHLRTNRNLDSSLAEIINANGFFDPDFQQGRCRKEKAKYQQSLKAATTLSTSEFLQFTANFHFDVGHPSWKELEHYIQAVLLDHKLGISDRQVFGELKRLVERHAIELHSPITFDLLDSILRESQSRFLLSQRFAVDDQRFVEPPTLAKQLDEMLAAVDGDYIVVTGPPGSGKSTALTKYFDNLDRSEQYQVVRYYCFVRIDDNRQRLRLEAQSLRVNLLDALHRSFSGVLDRRFDVSENNFLSSLQHLGTHCRSNGQKLIVFIDGLDHAERDDTVRDDIAHALPAQLPAGVVFVVGTQELRRWTPLALQHGRERHHIQMPLFSYRETEYYLRTGCQLAISDTAVRQVQQKSAGLPLYLRYIAELMPAAEQPKDVVGSLPATVEGDIRHYYDMLWGAFDADGRGHAKYLSFVLALLRFRVHCAELYDFQKEIPRALFDEAYRQVRHLLRDQDGLIGVFHNSFRAFVLDRMDSRVRQEIVTAISDRLKQEECSPRWYKHSFAYATEAQDHRYALARINREFVDQALLHNRDSDTIEGAIRVAIEAAAAESDIVHLSRLGSLFHRTNERLEYQFPWLTRAETLLFLGRVDDVVTEFYSENSQHLEVSHGFALPIVLWLKELGRDSLAEKLFRDVLDDRAEQGTLGKEGIIDLAQCAGIFPTNFANVMRLLADASISRDMLEPQGFEPEYAPHLEAYLKGVVSQKSEHIWEWMKPLENPFPNRAIRYFVIRAVAQHKPGALLAREIAEYRHCYPDDTNVELAFLATKARMPAAFVQLLAGQFTMPKETVGDHDLREALQRQIREFAYWAVILGYTRNDAVTEPIRVRLQNDNSVWAATLGHLLHVGRLVGAHRANDSIDCFDAAIQSIERLKTASDVPYERTPDALDAARVILPDSLRWASEVLAERCPERLDEWVTALVDLRGSFIWTTHYGIGEYIQNYSFEFPIWRGLAQLPAMRHILKPVLADCATSYAHATKLKGGSRGDHFLELSAVAARCGFRDDAEQWLREGVSGTLAYGYHKDNTLMNLAEVLRRVNKYQPEKALDRSAAILEMIKWMQNVTDGRITQDFPQEFFPTVLSADREAALELLRYYYRHFGRWQADLCTKEYILSRNSGDPEYFWALASLLHPNGSLKCRQHIAGLPAVDPSNAYASWSERLLHYVLTSMNPAFWPEEVATAQSRPERAEESRGGVLEPRPLSLDGNVVTEEQVIELCRQSIDAMIDVLDKLHSHNEHVSDHRIVDAVVPFHIDRARTEDDLAKIVGVVETRDEYARATYFARLGSRYIQQGNVNRASALLEKAFRDWVSTTTVESCIATLARFDKNAARRVCIDGIRDSLGPSYRGLDTPCVAAAACEVFGENDNLERVFDDFLAHCQELFAYLPDERWFDWLKEYVPRDTDETKQIVDLLLEQLAEPEIELGRRLVAATCELCCERGAPVVQAVVERVLQVDGLQQTRLLQVLQAVAHSQPESVRHYGQQLATLLERKNASITLLARDILRSAFYGIEPPTEIVERLAQLDRDYSSVVAYKNFRILHSDASPEFKELLRRAALLDFHRQLNACCEVFALDVDQMVGHLERRFNERGGSVEAEREEYKYEWKGHVDPQGWPVTWIIPSFHVKISELLYETIDEILRKSRVRPTIVEAVWHIIQPSDPGYVSEHLTPKPADLPAIVVTDEDQWMAALDAVEQRTITGDFQGEWVTVFEHWEIAQAGTYYVQHKAMVRTSAALVCPEHLGSVEETEADFEHWIVTHHPYENLTWRQFQEGVMAAIHLRFPEDMDMWPVVSTKRSSLGFTGVHTLATLCPYIIGDHSLEFSGHDLLHATEKVARCEMWREGWFSSDYSDAPMAFGCRLQVRAAFLRMLCNLYHRGFVIRTEERRECYESYRKEPARSQEKTRYTILAIDSHQDDNETAS